MSRKKRLHQKLPNVSIFPWRDTMLARADLEDLSSLLLGRMKADIGGLGETLMAAYVNSNGRITVIREEDMYIDHRINYHSALKLYKDTSEKQISALRKTTELIQGENKGLRAVKAAADACIVALNDTLDAKELLITAQAVIITSKDQELAAKDEELVAKDQALTAKEQELTFFKEAVNLLSTPPLTEDPVVVPPTEEVTDKDA